MNVINHTRFSSIYWTRSGGRINEECSSSHDFTGVAEGQPFHLDLIAAIAHQLGDIPLDPQDWSSTRCLLSYPGLMRGPMKEELRGEEEPT